MSRQEGEDVRRTELEQQVRRALDRAAQDRQVDPNRLLGEVHARLGAPTRTQRHHRRAMPLLVAAAVAATVGVGVLLPGLVRSVGGTAADLGSTGDALVHQVDADFTCSRTRDVPLDGSQDEFVPDLDRLDGPKGVAAEQGAPRYAFEVDGDRAALRLGNDDGTLGSVTTYRREDDEWVPVTSTACTLSVPSDGRSGEAALPLVTDVPAGPSVPPAPRSLAGDGAEPVLVDARSSYTYAGLVERPEALYADPCGDRLCLYRVEDDGFTRFRLEPTTQPQRVGAAMVDPDDTVGRSNPYEFWVAWDPDRTIGRLTAVGGDARSRRITDPSWDGARAHVLLLPAGSDATVGMLGVATAERYDP